MPDLAAPLLVADLLRTQAEGRPDATALVDGTRALSFRELSDLAGTIAGGLADAGVVAGDRVVVQSAQSIEAYAAWFAVNALGAALVPFSPANNDAEVAFAARDCAARVVLRESDLRRLAAGRHEPLPENLAGDEREAALIRYSSGTTDGRAKGIVLSHRSLVLTFWLEAIEFGHRAGTVFLAYLPWNGAGGFFALSHLAVGGSAVLLPRFDVEAFWGAAREHRATHALVVPTVAVRLLAASPPSPAVSIATVVSTGAPLAEPVRERLAALCGGEVTDCYGSTETEVALVRRRGDPGMGHNSVTSLIRILDANGSPVADGHTGEIAKRGPDVFSGYWNRPELTAAAVAPGGYVRTGDIGTRAADGSVTMADRRDDLILTGGHNVAPAEVESVLLESAEVVEAAVVGRPDQEWGEVPVAAVVVRPSSAVTAGDLLGHCATRLARHKVPRALEIVPELPHSPAGKVLRRAVREQLLGPTHMRRESPEQ